MEREKKIHPQANVMKGRKEFYVLFTFTNFMNHLFNFILLNIQTIIIKMNMLR